MGNGNSIPSNINKQNELIQEIHAVANELSAQYNNKYLDPKFCTTVALIYNDKLMSYRKVDLNNIAMTLGVVADIPGQKQQICESIVKHYTDRLNLVAAMQHSLNFCSNRIFALYTGPRCNGYPELFDEPTCTKSGGQWEGHVVPPDYDVSENRQWYNYMSHMQDTYIRALSRILDILKQLQDFDQDINDEHLKKLGTEVELLIDTMQGTCSKVYKLMLTTPTFTEGELQMIKDNAATTEQEAAAKQAALRASRNLPPVS